MASTQTDLLPGGARTLFEQPDLIEAYARTGREDEAREALATLERAAERTGSSWARAAALRCQGVLASAEEFEPLFQEALREHARTPTPFERARTELCYGERLRRERRRADSRPHLRAALDTFERLRAEPWTRRAQAELDASVETARRDGAERDRLTSQELEVATLVAEGATNKEAAAALFVSPKTIDAHLQHIYRKLDLHSRTQLAGLLAERAGAELAHAIDGIRADSGTQLDPGIMGALERAAAVLPHRSRAGGRRASPRVLALLLALTLGIAGAAVASETGLLDKLFGGSGAQESDDASPLEDREPAKSKHPRDTSRHPHGRDRPGAADPDLGFREAIARLRSAGARSGRARHKSGAGSRTRSGRHRRDGTSAGGGGTSPAAIPRPESGPGSPGDASVTRPPSTDSPQGGDGGSGGGSPDGSPSSPGGSSPADPGGGSPSAPPEAPPDGGPPNGTPGDTPGNGPPPRPDGSPNGPPGDTPGNGPPSRPDGSPNGHPPTGPPGGGPPGQDKDSSTG